MCIIFLATRVRTDKRWDAGVGARGGLPGSTAREWRSLTVDQKRILPSLKTVKRSEVLLKYY
jgi:hypothetical protein